MRAGRSSRLLVEESTPEPGAAAGQRGATTGVAHYTAATGSYQWMRYLDSGFATATTGVGGQAGVGRAGWAGPRTGPGPTAVRPGCRTAARTSPSGSACRTKRPGPSP